MGDRAIVIFKRTRNSGTNLELETEYSSAVYLHWYGGEVLEWLKEAAPTMRARDVGYACARFIAFCGTKINPPLSLGVFNTPPNKKGAEYTTKEIADISHGDRGVFIVDCMIGAVRNYSYEHPKGVNCKVTLEMSNE